jgi:site-specific DNA-methyltransferase (adenine-specific)
MNEKIKLLNCEAYEYTSQHIADNSIDIILTDPPYLYLKHKLDRPFNEDIFTEFFRVLKPGGFVIVFGRGQSFYRWNTRLCDCGFTFKEEIIWNKCYCSSPLMSINRTHETISIFSNGNTKINIVKNNYLIERQYDIKKIIADIKRIVSALNNEKEMSELQAYLETKIVDYNKNRNQKYDFLTTGLKKECSRTVLCLNGIIKGIKEKSIITEVSNKYKAIHPTEKPVALLERLLRLVVKPEHSIVFDPFAGGGSTGVAAHNLGLNFIGCEIDKEYYTAAAARLDAHSKPTLFDNDNE